MHTFILQDWTTVKGGAGVSVTQPAEEWLDLEPFESFVAWLEMRDFSTPGMTMVLESSPTKDEALFAIDNLNPVSLTFALGVQTSTNLLSSPFEEQRPLLRWLRWRIDGSSTGATWSATFRLLLSAYSTLG